MSLAWQIDKSQQEVKNAHRHFDEHGWVILSISDVKKTTHMLKQKFELDFASKFSDNASFNRNIIKRFADLPGIANIYSHLATIEAVRQVCAIGEPVFCGPVVSHYTSNDQTGQGFGLPFHQDYPSMGSSKTSVICWISLADSSPEHHGVALVSGEHKKGLLQGEQTSSGYVLSSQEEYDTKSIVPTILAGEVLIMSSFTPHKTFVNPNFKGWKLSFSRRYDDFNDTSWQSLGLTNAYNITVDRKLYLQSLD